MRSSVQCFETIIDVLERATGNNKDPVPLSIGERALLQEPSLSAISLPVLKIMLAEIHK